MAIGGKGFTSQLFTASGSWTCPAGVTQIILIGSGGGQGGKAGGTSTGVVAVGGKATVPCMKSISVVPNTTYTITIGSGGIGGTAPNGAGGGGGNTTFGILATFYGASSDSTQDANAGCAFPGPTGSLSRSWNSVSTKASDSGTYYGGGDGAGGTGVGGFVIYGGPGGNGNNGGAGAAGQAPTVGSYGAGGGGGGAGSSSGGNGGVGNSGFLRVIWTEA